MSSTLTLTAQRLCSLGLLATLTVAGVASESLAQTSETAGSQSRAKDDGTLQEVVVTAGVPFNQPGTTNALRVAHVK